MRPDLAALALAALCALPRVAGAEPAPVRAIDAAFPGSFTEPASARIAGTALAGAWLGDEVAGNPAGALGARSVSASGLFLRLNRQDLRRGNRQFDEQGGFFDLASAEARATARGFGFAAYVFQPLLRRESEAYLLGDITAPPATRTTEASARETRAGLAVARPFQAAGQRWSAGLAGEWVQRKDRYLLIEENGGPTSGTTTTEFDGTGWGLQAGLAWSNGEGGDAAGRVRAGLSWRYGAALDLAGSRRAELAGADTVETLAGERAAVSQLGASVSWRASPAVEVGAGLGLRGREDYGGLGARTGRGNLWAFSARYHEPTLSWSAWLGLGGEELRDAPEPRAGLLGLGFGWTFGDYALDVSGLRRTLDGGSGPNSFDYRVLATLSVDL